MRRIVFLISHIGSDSDKLVDILNENPRVEILQTGRKYDHPSDLDFLVLRKHKLGGAAAIHGDHLLLNIAFSCEALHSICKFIYMVREAKPSLNENTFHPRRTVETYYRFRLRRMYEMAYKTPGAVLLTWDDVRTGRGLSVIEEYLGLKDSLVPQAERFIKSTQDHIPFESVDRAQDAYEEYLYRMRSLDLRQVSR